ncbi:MAG: hypothetical protein IKU03_04495 [Bacteroidales bacterium]|nr:hypothetical protein [Bacteroidales bacterium]
MFKNNHKILLTLIALTTLCLITNSCQKGTLKKERNQTTVAHSFPNTNWAFEEQVLDFDFENPDSTANYQISFLLNYDANTVTMDEIPITATLIAPNGMESFVTSTFRLKETNAFSKSLEDGSTLQEVVVFPKKDLNQKGHYKVSLYRKAAKADNYGFNSITLKVSKLKKSRS